MRRRIKSRFLEAIRVNNTIDNSWEEFLSKDLIDEIDNVEEKLVCNYTSCDSKVLRFLTVDLNRTYKASKDGKDITKIENKEINKFKNDIDTNNFPIKSLNEIFDYWEEQDVLFLNCSFTCELNKPGCHLNYWDKFDKKLVKYIINKNPNAKYFLWGEKVKNIISNIDDFKNIPDKLIYECTHPANRNSKAKGKNFLESECFKDTMNEIAWI